MSKRIYRIDSEMVDAVGEAYTYLVRASTKAQAIARVTNGMFDCRVATQDDLVEAMQQGIGIWETGSVDNGEDNGS